MEEGSEKEAAEETSSTRQGQSDAEDRDREDGDLLSGALIDLRREIRSRSRSKRTRGQAVKRDA